MEDYVGKEARDVYLVVSPEDKVDFSHLDGKMKVDKIAIVENADLNVIEVLDPEEEVS